jgi:hypothetical protein
MSSCKQEIALTTVYGNQFRICSVAASREFPCVPENSVMILFDDKGIVVPKEEINKLKSFLESM